MYFEGKNHRSKTDFRMYENKLVGLSSGQNCKSLLFPLNTENNESNPLKKYKNKSQVSAGLKTILFSNLTPYGLVDG